MQHFMTANKTGWDPNRVFVQKRGETGRTNKEAKNDYSRKWAVLDGNLCATLNVEVTQSRRAQVGGFLGRSRVELAKHL